MVLNREHRFAGVAKAFNGAVVQVQMRDLHIRGQRIRVDGEAMILGRDLDLARIKLLHRVVGAAVAELQFERLTSDGKPENLMAETDAEGWNIGVHQLAYALGGIGELYRIDPPVAEKDPVGLDREQLARRSGRGKHTHITAVRVQPAKNVPLD